MNVVMMKAAIVAAAMMATAGVAGSASAQVNYAISNTGTADAYTVTTGTGVGNTNPGAPASAFIVTNPVWSANTGSSSWISVASSGQGSPDTTYTYSTSFAVTGAATPGTSTVLNLLLAADDAITSIRLTNSAGTSTLFTGSASNSGYPSLTPYALTAVLENGTNTLSFSVYNQQPNGTTNPTGFRLEGAVPEPATWGMMIVGFGLVGFAMRHAARRSEEKFNAKIKRIAEGAIA